MGTHSISVDIPLPHPELLPEDVVGLIMDGFMNHKHTETGPLTLYNFSSPKYIEATGSYDLYLELLNHPKFVPLLSLAEFKLLKSREDDTMAQVPVLINTFEDELRVYLFTLTRNYDGALKDCWVTDSIRLLVHRYL